jgi:hypothetical protein
MPPWSQFESEVQPRRLERHDDMLWLSGRMKITILTISIPMCN